MFSINWKDRSSELIPQRKRFTIRKAWILLIIFPLRSLFDDFLLFRNGILYRLQFNSQIIYLEKLLNDQFSPTIGGIFIQNTADTNRVYLYNKQEVRTSIVLYNKWKNADNYLTDEIVSRSGNNYKAKNNNSASDPLLLIDWDLHSPTVVLRNKGDNPVLFDFVINVPVALTFDSNKMKALVNRYKLAGKRYTITTY